MVTSWPATPWRRPGALHDKAARTRTSGTATAALALLTPRAITAIRLPPPRRVQPKPSVQTGHPNTATRCSEDLKAEAAERPSDWPTIYVPPNVRAAIALPVAE